MREVMVLCGDSQHMLTCCVASVCLQALSANDIQERHAGCVRCSNKVSAPACSPEAHFVS